MNTDLVFMYQGKVSVLGFNITGGNEYRLGIYVIKSTGDNNRKTGSE
jgi:hypothetical protein